MINLIARWIWVLSLASAGVVNAQQNDLFKDLSAKVLFVDYSMFNGEKGLKSTYGLEFSYRQQLNPFLAVAAPLKLSIVNVPGMLTNQTGISLDALLHVFPLPRQSRWSPYLLGGVGRAWESGTNGHWQLPVGLGVNRRITDELLLGLQAEYRTATIEKRNNLQLAAGYVYRLGGIIDADGDGVANGQDACPNVKGSPKAKGCPDQDGDGVADAEDACPGLPGEKQLAGCPDTDGDGLADAADACPQAAGKAEHQGCPDTDGDGLADQLDGCPELAGPTENKGCPLTDTDGDGLADEADKCPEEAGTVETQGCPELKQDMREVLSSASRTVQFESGKDVLLESSLSVLDQIASVMRAYPAYQLVISAHTDDAGDEKDNLRLSEDRAKACFEYLRTKDIPSARMRYAGYGQSQPVADNASAEGRALNQRVEFDLIIQ